VLKLIHYNPKLSIKEIAKQAGVLKREVSYIKRNNDLIKKYKPRKKNPGTARQHLTTNAFKYLGKQAALNELIKNPILPTRLIRKKLASKGYGKVPAHIIKGLKKIILGQDINKLNKLIQTKRIDKIILANPEFSPQKIAFKLKKSRQRKIENLNFIRTRIRLLRKYQLIKKS